MWRTGKLAIILGAAALASFAQTTAPRSSPPQSNPPQTTSRDLRYEKDGLPLPAVAKAPEIPRSYALVIGIAQYQKLNPEENLRYSERDAQAIYSILISPEGGNFPAENVHKLIGPKATFANIRRELETWLPGMAKDDDRVLVYFAGHGFISPQDGKPYLAPYDIDRNNIAGTGYSMDTLGDVFGSKIHGKWKVLLTDACHSGAITPANDRQAINGRLLNLGQSVFSLTASTDREQSYESPNWGGGRGIFSYYVEKGFQGEADDNGDGVVTAGELAEYVHQQVREATKNAEGGQQNPTSERGSFARDMLLAYNPSGVKTDQPQAEPKTGGLVFTANMEGVEVFLDGKSQGVAGKGTPLRLPGLQPGAHTIKAVKMGYEPDGPREQFVYPGREATVNIKILIPVRRTRAAVEEFDKGLQLYMQGGKSNYEKAATNLEKALSLEPRYSQAALYLGRTYDALLEEEKAQQYMRRAVEIDPDYLEAHSSYAGMLLGIGDLDEAVRQLNVVIQRDPRQGFAHYLLCEAYRRKESYPQAIEEGRQAVQLIPEKAEAHFWLAEGLRMSKQFAEARAEYFQYLRLSDFDTKLSGQLNYYLLGSLIGVGKRKHAAQKDIWKELQAKAYFGICNCEYTLKHWDKAIAACQRSLSFTPDDPFTHFLLAKGFEQRALNTGNAGPLAAALTHFDRVIEINPQMQEADTARQNAKIIDEYLRTH